MPVITNDELNQYIDEVFHATKVAILLFEELHGPGQSCEEHAACLGLTLLKDRIGKHYGNLAGMLLALAPFPEQSGTR
jgi:hypothetical protein